MEPIEGLPGQQGVTQVTAAEDLTLAYRRLWPSSVRLAQLITGSLSLGEEVAQEVFVGVIRKDTAIDNLDAYIRRAVVNRATTAKFRELREYAYADKQAESIGYIPEIDETWDLLKRLSKRQRTVLVLRFYLDLSEAETAQILGCPPGTVKSLSSRAISKLRGWYK